MELAWRHPFSAIVCGPAQSGKTVFVKRLVKNRKEMIHPPPKHVYWCYTEYQPGYESLQSDPEITFIHGFPDSSAIRECLVIFDDMMLECKDNPFLLALATKGSHHWSVSCIQILQNAFFGGRTTRINSQYIILMKNPADKLQVATLGRQIFPDNTKYFKEAFEDSTRDPHGYLMVDLSQDTPEHARLRTHIFPGQQTIVYTPINKTTWKCSSQF